MSSDTAGTSSGWDRGGGPTAEQMGYEFSPLALVNVLLRRRRLIFGVTGAVLMVSLGFAVFWTRPYEAESRMMPSGSERAGAAGLAAELVGLRSAGQVPLQFYVELLRSRDLLEQLALTEFQFEVGDPEAPDTVKGTLIELYQVGNPSDDQAVIEAVRLIRRDVVSASASQASNTVTITTKAPWPELAVAINRRLLELVNEFNLDRRQSQSQFERAFVEGRLPQAEEELREAEADLRSFLERNRQYEHSPELRFEAASLQRRLDLRQEVYLTLSRAYEEARIDEVRNTPVVTVVDHPERSIRRAGLRRPVLLLLGLVLGLFLSIGLSFIWEYFARGAGDADEYREFDELRRAALRDVLPSRVRPGRAAVSRHEVVPNDRSHPADRVGS